MHTVTCKLNNGARQHPNESGMTFFVSLGEQNYNRATKQKEWTNYEAALFAKDGQIQYYTDVLIKGAIITVSGTGLIPKIDPGGQYPPKFEMQESKLEFAVAGSAPQQQAPQQQQQPAQQHQPHGAAPPQQPTQQQYQQAPQQQQQPAQRQPAYQAPPQSAQQMMQADNNQGFDNFDDDIPFN